MQQSLEEILRSKMAQPVSIKGKEGAPLLFEHEFHELNNKNYAQRTSKIDASVPH